MSLEKLREIGDSLLGCVREMSDIELAEASLLVQEVAAEALVLLSRGRLQNVLFEAVNDAILAARPTLAEDYSTVLFKQGMDELLTLLLPGSSEQAEEDGSSLLSADPMSPTVALLSQPPFEAVLPPSTSLEHGEVTAKILTGDISNGIERTLLGDVVTADVPVSDSSWITTPKPTPSIMSTSVPNQDICNHVNFMEKSYVVSTSGQSSSSTENIEGLLCSSTPITNHMIYFNNSSESFTKPVVPGNTSNPYSFKESQSQDDRIANMLSNPETKGASIVGNAQNQSESPLSNLSFSSSSLQHVHTNQNIFQTGKNSFEQSFGEDPTKSVKSNQSAPAVSDTIAMLSGQKNTVPLLTTSGLTNVLSACTTGVVNTTRSITTPIFVQIPSMLPNLPLAQYKLSSPTVTAGATDVTIVTPTDSFLSNRGQVRMTHCVSKVPEVTMAEEGLVNKQDIFEHVNDSAHLSSVLPVSQSSTKHCTNTLLSSSKALSTASLSKQCNISKLNMNDNLVTTQKSAYHSSWRGSSVLRQNYHSKLDISKSSNVQVSPLSLSKRSIAMSILGIPNIIVATRLINPKSAPQRSPPVACKEVTTTTDVALEHCEVLVAKKNNNSQSDHDSRASVTNSTGDSMDVTSPPTDANTGSASPMTNQLEPSTDRIPQQTVSSDTPLLYAKQCKTVKQKKRVNKKLPKEPGCMMVEGDIMVQVLADGRLEFSCLKCSRSFSQRNTLASHMMLHTDQRPFTCPECHVSFKRKEHLQVHQRTHTGERPCVCSHCGKAFAQVTTLKRHLVVHTKSKDFSCSFCEQNFTYRASLVLHMKKHEGTQPYCCDICQARFWRKDYLKKHKCHRKHFTKIRKEAIPDQQNEPGLKKTNKKTLRTVSNEMLKSNVTKKRKNVDSLKSTTE